MIAWLIENEVWFHFALFILIALWLEIRLERYMDKLEESYVGRHPELLRDGFDIHAARRAAETQWDE